ncbi:MAG: bifunctional protein-serine/threonine kinase/phosphatase [Xanthobacteraceae bacterium]|nr:bifunctional protein-serine/threonine kinase/phosphatase [Xanthobacteraceae bacterium]
MRHVDGPAARATRLELRFGMATDTGPREANEDYSAFYLGNPDEQARLGAVAVIADGVGGAQGGRVAAELAVRAFVEGHLGQNATLGIRRNCARTIEAFNSWAHAIGSRDPSLAGMATTLTALVFRGRRVHVIHVGDTRAYRWRDGALDRMTSDHTMSGAGLRHVLTRAVGADESIRIDYASDMVRVYDRYLLCSDGIHGGVPDQTVRGVLAQRNAPDETARELVAAGLAARTGDNATALVIDVIGLPPADHADLAFAAAGLALLPVPKVGATVDGFHLRAMLADGRYTRVFEAEDTIEKRRVVLKFPKAITGAEGVLRDAFLREAWIAARIRSPWIGETIELPPERQSGLYTAMPFYDGETLERRLSRSPRLSLTAGLDYAIKLAGGVAALHRAGVVHRDIKPDNVILEAIRGREVPGLRLVDLGVARLPHMEDIPAPHAPGTPSYMAPELFTGAAGDERSDQFALGVTIYRMFTGEYPYGEIEAFSHPRFKRATPLTKHRPDLPAWLDEALARATAASPDDRFGDVFELIFALEHGAIRAAPASPHRQPLYERNPLLVWKIVAAILALALAVSLALNPTIRHDAPEKPRDTQQK